MLRCQFFFDIQFDPFQVYEPLFGDLLAGTVNIGNALF